MKHIIVPRVSFDIYSDDFRTAMHQANSAIKALVLLSRQHSYDHPASSAGSPSTSPSISTLPNPATASEVELSRARIENMAKLIGLLQRNVRVKYELDVGEVVHALAHVFSCQPQRLTRGILQRITIPCGQSLQASSSYSL